MADTVNFPVTRVRYHHFYTTDTGGRATLAAAFCSDGEVHFGVAYCNPRDNFCRAIGRQIAEGRLRKGRDDTPSSLSVVPQEDLDYFMGKIDLDISRLYAEAITDRKELRSWSQS